MKTLLCKFAPGQKLAISLQIVMCALFSAANLNAADLAFGPATAINTLGLDLLRQTGKPEANALLSPYSIQSALAMAYAGSEGATRQEMARVLHFPVDDTIVNGWFATLRRALEEAAEQSAKASEAMKKYGGTNDPFTLTIANRLFGQTGYDFRAPFLATLKDRYDAPFEALDFIHNSAAATRQINDWGEGKTHQRIRNVIPADALGPLTRLVLVNAIYLKAPWMDRFPAAATKPGTFHLDARRTAEVPMMAQTHECSYFQGAGFSVVQLPYADAGLSFVIFLPDSLTGLASLEAKLTPALIDGSFIKWETRDVHISMPRLKLEPPLLPLGQTLQTLGMKTAFDMPRGSANFDRIAPRRPDDYLALSDVFHKTFLKLDEGGTEAAAATALMAYTLGIHQPKQPIEIKVDHPFLFAIRHGPSGACLFLGHVADPR